MIFEDFKKTAIDEISTLQEKFIKTYNLYSYEEYYYDHGLGIFEFKSEEKHLYFRYVDVGSFSNNTQTWNWSWNNEDTPFTAEKGMESVKLFAQDHDFELMTTGLINGDGHTGWEMTAITCKLLNGIGIYKVPDEHLEVFFVFTEELQEEEFKSLKQKYVSCGAHGSRRRAFICQHLSKEKLTGFHETFPSYSDADEQDDSQAWCDACEQVRIRDDG
ncbi:MAG TPA: hypothetical protein VL947_10695, partial [Cytophagales bacterium]|nr:hypothetical protein [Cytophagales bacterium]